VRQALCAKVTQESRVQCSNTHILAGATASTQTKVTTSQTATLPSSTPVLQAPTQSTLQATRQSDKALVRLVPLATDVMTLRCHLRLAHLEPSKRIRAEQAATTAQAGSIHFSGKLSAINLLVATTFLRAALRGSHVTVIRVGGQMKEHHRAQGLVSTTSTLQQAPLKLTSASGAFFVNAG
jgi:hypothetical protein